MMELLKRLSESFGPSGHEKRVADLIIEEIRDYCDEIFVDKLGNVIALKKGQSDKKIMYASHIDEIGLLVTYIEKEGFLRFTNIGGVSPYILLGQRVKLDCGIIGVIGSEKITDIPKLTLDKMFIDIGVNSKEEAEKLISIGEVAVIHREFENKGDKVIGKALDDRAGCWVLINALKQIKNPEHNLYFVFTVQEEVGLRGAKTAAYRIDPDLAIAVDVTAVGDTPKAHRMAVELGKGPAIKIKDMSIMVHPMVKDMLIQKAKELSIPYQLEVLEFGGTDSGAIHVSREGVWAGVVSIPCRYIHSPSEMVSVDDLNNAVKLIVASTEFEF
nr:M42 family metallopeptidase [Anaerobranca gottschalkii]